LPHIAKRYSRLTTRPETLDDLADYMLVQWHPDQQVQVLQPWNTLVEQRQAAVVRAGLLIDAGNDPLRRLHRFAALHEPL
jgi:hypothetical protein